MSVKGVRSWMLSVCGPLFTRGGRRESRSEATRDFPEPEAVFRVHVMLTIPSKRKGFDKALFQIEQALKRVKSGKQTPEDSKVVLDLKHLLGEAADTQITGPASVPGQTSSAGDTHEPIFSDDDQETEDSPDSRAFLSRHCDGSLTVDDAENPLQLLARASNLQLSPTPSGAGTSPAHSTRRKDRKQKHGNDGGKSDIESFFTGVRVNLDVGEDIDPIEMGLVTEAEADELFD